MAKKKKDIFRQAKQQAEFDKPNTLIGTHKFIDWLCSKEEILTEPITPIEEANL